jgi:hypothetical protein
MKQRRAIFYIDGYNLFYGLKEQGWRKYYWLDLSTFAQQILKPEQKLVAVKYFTSRIASDPHERIRQGTYIEALETLPNITFQYGKFMTDTMVCTNQACKRNLQIHNEKQTDVNIAVSLLGDAQDGHFDDAYLVTADSDQVGTVSYVREHYPDLRVIIAFPPKRVSNELRTVASGVFHLRESHFSGCQFPEELLSKKGFKLTRPISWQ